MNSQPSGCRIYFHVGLAKAASTYLQKRIFPALKGIHYVHRNRYWQYQQIISKTPADQFLVSREAAEHLERRVMEFADYRRDGRVILVLRRHDDWIASHYRRYVKNGGSFPIEDYLDQGALLGRNWRRGDTCFMQMISMIEGYFASAPLVLFHEQLRHEHWHFVNQLAGFMGCSYNPKDIDPRPMHLSWNEKQLKLARAFSRYVFNPVQSAHSNPSINRVQRRLRLWSCYLILGASGLVPSRLAGKDPLIPSSVLERVRDVYAPDWESAKSYAQAHNPAV